MERPKGLPRFTLLRGAEFLIAVTGLALVLFLFGHLAGNFFLFAGPEAFNSYAAHLQSLGPLLWVARIGLITAFGCHMAATIYTVLYNRQARGGRYAVKANTGRKGLATRTMIYTGLTVAALLAFHLSDFTFASKESGVAHAAEAGAAAADLGLYGLVWNAFANPLHAAVYIVFVCCVGFHLSHSLSSIWITLGVLNERATTAVEWAARAVGAALALGFSSIPIYVLIQAHLMGGLN